MPTDESNILLCDIEKMRAELAEKKEKGIRMECKAVRENGLVVGWDFPCTDGRVARCGPLLYPWLPHEPNTWPHRYMTTKAPVTLFKWNQKHPVEENTATVELPIGTRVKIVMVSRLGDVGITDDLAAEHGYHARFMINNLSEQFENFGMVP